MTNLNVLDGSYGYSPLPIPFVKDMRDEISEILADKSTFLENILSETNRKVLKEVQKYQLNPRIVVPIPQNLKSVNASHSTLSGNVTEVHVLKNNVTTIDISFNLFVSFFGPIHNVERVEFFDVSNNFLKEIGPDSFRNATNVIVFNLSQNYLGDVFRQDDNGLIFFHQTRLQVLRIASNKIQELPVYIFQNMNDLEFLDVSNNDLIDWVPKISHMRNLSLLDISRNRFEDVPTKLRKTITQLTKHRQMQLKISGNSFKCDCAHLQSLYWMSTSNINITDLQLATCTLWNGETKSLDNLQDVLMSLQKHCQTTIPLILGAVVALIFFLIILISGFVYRYRWKLRYLYYITKRRYQRVEVQDDFIYDAFVSYADEDTLFVVNDMRHMLEDEFGLKLCIHHRDFMVGQVISENILDAVKSSRKTIVILSPHFLKSSWCNYEVQMAKMEAIHAGRDVICVLWYQDVPDMRNISSDLLQEMANNTYIKYPGPGEGLDLFWESLRDAVA